MATTLMPLDPALSPQRVNRILTISADLLPAEIVAARRARRSRGWVVVALVVVVALLAGWYVYADREVRAVSDELGRATAQATALQKRQTEPDYREVVDVQNETGAISKELSTLLRNDLPWSALLNTLRSTAADSGASVTSISGLLADSTTNAAEALPSTTGDLTIGSVTIIGSAPDKPTVAKYVDALGKLGIVANPYLTNATIGDKDDWQFTVTVDITSATLCGRFTTKCKTTGGN
jgi:hypothetical protein